MNEESRTVDLTGGSPWGLRIQGGADFRAPLKVTKVSPGGKAALAGVQVSDVIKRIGETNCATLRHSEALYLIRTSGSCLSLVLQTGGSVPSPYLPHKLHASAAAKPASPAKKQTSVVASPPAPAETPEPSTGISSSPARQKPEPQPQSPAKVPGSTGFERESAGGKDWYRAMHRSQEASQSEEQPLTCGKSEKEAPKPQPIKPKPRSYQFIAPAPTSPPAQPTPDQPVPSQSLPPQPVSFQPTPYQSVPSQPPQPVSSQPTPSQSLPPQPIPSQPTPYQSVPSQSPSSPPLTFLPESPPSTNGNASSGPVSPPNLSPEYAVPDQSNPAETAAPKAPVADSEKRRSGKRKRELKPPPADWARALYDFTAETKHELSFKKGAKLRLLRTVDDNWLEAQLQNARGIIPVSYVELLSAPAAPPSPAPSPAPGPPGAHALALYDFAAEEAYELAFQKGQVVALLSRVDENWLQGRVGDKTGIFPASFVEVAVPLGEIAPPEQLVENEIRTRGNSHQSPPLQQGEMFRAVYSYAPQNSDELALSPGTEVFVVRKCEDGWFMGYSEETGAFGTFPGNYVKAIL